MAAYTEIPQNRSRFLDILISNAQFLNEEYAAGTRVGLQYSEVLEEGQIHFRPAIVQQGDLTEYYGHKHWDAARPEHLRELKAFAAHFDLFRPTSS